MDSFLLTVDSLYPMPSSSGLKIDCRFFNFSTRKKNRFYFLKITFSFAWVNFFVDLYFTILSYTCAIKCQFHRIYRNFLSSIESTLQSDSFNDRKVPLPFVVGSSSERNAGSADFRAVITVTPTVTTTLFSTVTMTWTPICSQWSPITQCPAQVG
jgi:hypothetical protein